MDTPLEIVSKSKNWMMYKFSYSLKNFTSAFKTPSSFNAKFLNGNQTIGGKTNRQFFKEDVKGGFYFHYTTDDFSKIVFIYYFEYDDFEKEPYITTNIKLRIKKVLNTRVESLPVLNVDERMKQFMTMSIGNLYTSFGNQRIKPQNR